jgi:signal transduction histidine kinase
MRLHLREMRELCDDLARAAQGPSAAGRAPDGSIFAIQTAVLEASPDGVIVLDLERGLAVYNRRCAELWQLPDALLATRDPRAIFSHARERLADPSGVLARLEELASDPAVRVEGEIRLRDGTILEGSSQPATDSAGALRGRLWRFRDVTARRRDEAELYLAKERAETASRAKSDFLLNMSHELRTPLNAILGFARVLSSSAEGRLSADERDYLGDILRAGDHMLQLVNDLLDLRSLEAHGLELGPVELLPQLDEAARMVQPLLRERAQTFELDAEVDLPACVGARRAIVQVLINLLTNAIKYTPEGGHIALRAHRDGAAVKIQVCDTGMGISGADQAKLFVYFEQLHAKHSHHMRGSGVGLALTRALVEKMGGSIAVTSEVCVGSTFEIQLRAA